MNKEKKNKKQIRTGRNVGPAIGGGGGHTNNEAGKRRLLLGNPRWFGEKPDVDGAVLLHR